MGNTGREFSLVGEPPQRVFKGVTFALSLSKGRSAVHGSTSSPRTVSIGFLETLSDPAPTAS